MTFLLLHYVVIYRKRNTVHLFVFAMVENGHVSQCHHNNYKQYGPQKSLEEIVNYRPNDTKRTSFIYHKIRKEKIVIHEELFPILFWAVYVFQNSIKNRYCSNYAKHAFQCNLKICQEAFVSTGNLWAVSNSEQLFNRSIFYETIYKK